MRDEAAVAAQPGGEVLGEADRDRAGDDDQPLPHAQALRHVDEVVERLHAVLARRGEVGQAEDQGLGRLELFDPGRPAERSGARLRDVVADRIEAGALPEGQLLRSDRAQADDSDA